jgi:hypothetical protein
VKALRGIAWKIWWSLSFIATLPAFQSVYSETASSKARRMDDDGIFPDLGFGERPLAEDYDRAMAKKKFFVPHGDESVGIGRSLFFVAQPTVVHFGGFTAHQTETQTVSVINSSSHSQRLSILPPTTNEFKV